MSGKLFIISAPSGAGKTTLVEHLLKQIHVKHTLSRVLTYTTRAARDNEEHGRDFYYISAAEFERKITQDYFIEWSNAYGCYYGTPRTIIQEMQKGASFILVADRAGAQQVTQHIPESVLIWIYTSSIQTLQDRLYKRATNTDEQIVYRLKLAQDEIEQESRNPLYHFHVLNDDFYEALQQLYAILHNSLT